MIKIILYFPKMCDEQDEKDLYMGLPLSIMALAAQLVQNAYDVEIVDGRIISEDSLANIVCDRESYHKVIVGISATTSYQIKDGLDFVRFFRRQRNDIIAVWGGWHPSLMPQQTIQNEFVDYIILGQGEIIFKELVAAICEDRSPETVPNLVYKNFKGEILYTEKKEWYPLYEIKSVSECYRYMDLNHYIGPLWGNKRVIGYESSRGCPWSCKYCSIGSIYQKRWEAFPIEQVVDDIEFLYENYNIDAIHFYDNNFFIDKKRILQFCQMLKERQIKIKWDGTCNVKQFLSFDKVFLDTLIESGFFRVIIGVESGDEDVLDRIGKLHKNDEVIEVVERCKKYNLLPSLSFMFGFPWNPEQDVEATVRLIFKLREIYQITEILLFVFTPYYGTDMYNIALEHGMNFPTKLEEWAEYTYSHFNTPWISNKLKRKMERYISFFGTKEMSKEVRAFYEGAKEEQ